MRDPRSIFITGASSGIGEALALAYAAPGVFLALTGRDAARLGAVAAAARAKGADAATFIVEVTDTAGLARCLAEADLRRPLDLVVANAGISGGGGRLPESRDQARRILAVNVDGVVDTVLLAVERFLARPAPAGRPRGQVAIMASLAGFRGMPTAPAYCASKAAVRVWGEALRAELHPHAIEVSVVCPGFVKSPMTAGNKFPMPFLISAGRAAEIVRRGLARNKARIAFPWRLYAIVRLAAALPSGFVDRLVRRRPKKAPAGP
jgi:short-subunit dehydrogenase